MLVGPTKLISQPTTGTWPTGQVAVWVFCIWVPRQGAVGAATGLSFLLPKGHPDSGLGLPGVGVLFGMCMRGGAHVWERNAWNLCTQLIYTASVWPAVCWHYVPRTGNRRWNVTGEKRLDPEGEGTPATAMALIRVSVPGFFLPPLSPLLCGLKISQNIRKVLNRDEKKRAHVT